MKADIIGVEVFTDVIVRCGEDMDVADRLTRFLHSRLDRPSMGAPCYASARACWDESVEDRQLRFCIHMPLPREEAIDHVTRAIEAFRE